MAGGKERAGDGQSISRAVTVLRVVADRPGASLGEIAKETGLARSTVQRLVNALNAEGLVTRVFGQQGVFLGMELARLGARVNLDARALLAPMMAELHGRIGDNIDLTTYDHGKVIVIDQYASNETIRVISYVGKHHPIHCTANGKAHLSQLTEAELEQVFAAPLERFSDATITDPAALMAQVRAYAEVGLFVDRGEYDEGASAVGIALPRFGEHRLALAVAMPTARLARREAEVKAALIEFRQSVEQAFGASI